MSSFPDWSQQLHKCKHRDRVKHVPTSGLLFSHADGFLIPCLNRDFKEIIPVIMIHHYDEKSQLKILQNTNMLNDRWMRRHGNCTREQCFVIWGTPTGVWAPGSREDVSLWWHRIESGFGSALARKDFHSPFQRGQGGSSMNTALEEWKFSR